MSEPNPTTLASWQAGDPDLMLASAEGEVRSYCGWHIWPEVTEDVVVNGTGQDVLPLPTLYLTAVNSVSETVGYGTEAIVTALVDGADYDWSQAGYLTRISYGFSRYWTTKLRGVTVNITHGYAECPPEVQAVILSVAARATDGADGAGIDQAGPFRYSPAKNSDGSTGGTVLTTLEKAVLDRYRVQRA